MRSLSTYSLLCLLFVASVFSLDTITRAGRYLYNSTDGSRFYIKGVAYQEEGASVIPFAIDMSSNCSPWCRHTWKRRCQQPSRADRVSPNRSF